MAVGAVAKVFRTLGTIIFKGDGLAAKNIAKVAKKEMSIFDMAKTFSHDVSKFAGNEKNKILPSNPFPDLKKYWNKYHGTKDFSWKELWKAGKLGEWLIPAGIVLPEIGNVWRAFTDEQGGVGTGLLETGKTTARVVGGSLGAIFGSLIPIPVLGPILGSMAGDWLAGRVVGSSFTEHSGGSGDEENKIANNQNGEQNTATTNTGNGAVDYSQQYAQQYNPMGYYNPFSTGLTGFNDYANDFMAQSIFGNPNQQNLSMENFGGNTTFTQQNDPLSRLGYLS